MAEAPAAAPPAPSTEAAPSPAPIMSLDQLDVRMAEIKANPEYAASEQEDGTAEQAAPSQPADPVQGDAPETDDADTANDPATGKPGGRFAKIRAQLTASEERQRALEADHQQRDQQYQGALRQFVDLVLPDGQFEQLRVQAEGGDWEAKQRIDTARQWRRMVAPIADLAHRASRQEFDQAIAELRTLDGMDGTAHQQLLQASTPGEKLKLMHSLARKSADTEHREHIAALEAEISSLKTNRAATGSQPASGGGRANGASGALAGWVGSDGLPTEEAIARARNGGFRDLGTP